MAAGGLVLPTVLVKGAGGKDVVRRMGEEKGRGGLLGGRRANLTKVRMAAGARAGERAGFAKGAGSSQRRRANCVPSLPCSQPAYPAAPQRYLKSNAVRITRISAYVAAAQRGEIATPLRRRGACGAGRERRSVGGGGAESCKQAGQGGCASLHLPKELYSRNCNTLMAKRAKIAVLGI